MKPYQEMIQFVVDQIENGTLRYTQWAAVLIIAEAYGISSAIVGADIKAEKEMRENALKEARKAENQRSNEQRRLANLARK
jgi:hypothetical protein